MQRTMFKSAIFKLCLVSFAWMPLSSYAETPLQNEALHTELVTTALSYDAFNQRCRGVSASKNKALVNRLFIRKYRVTVNNYIKEYLTDDPRITEAQYRGEMNKKISELGGCQQARSKGLEKELRKQYRQLYRSTESSTWLPVVTRK